MPTLPWAHRRGEARLGSRLGGGGMEVAVVGGEERRRAREVRRPVPTEVLGVVNARAEEPIESAHRLGVLQ